MLCCKDDTGWPTACDIAALCAVMQTPFARDSMLKDEVVDKLNEALT